MAQNCLASKSVNLQLDGLDVRFTRKRIKNLNIRISRDGNVLVSAPYAMPLSEVTDFIRSRASWIQAKQAELARKRTAPIHWESGDTLWLWGRPFTLKLVSLPEADEYPAVVVSLEADELHLLADKRLCGLDEQAVATREKAVRLWQRQQLADVLPALFSRYEAIVGKECSRWRLRQMKTRWGSCNVYKGTITINTELIAFEPRCLEYVVCHELCHLIEPNHSPRFYAQMQRCFPEWREVKDILARGVG